MYSKSEACQKLWFKKYLTFPNFFSQITAFKETTELPFLTFLWFRLTDETEFLKVVFPTIFKLLKRIFVSKPDALLNFRLKIWRVLKKLIQNLIFFEVFEAKKVFCPKTSLSEPSLPKQHEIANCVVLKL